MDFIAQIRATLDTKEAQSKLDTFLQSKKNRTLQLTVDNSDLLKKIESINGEKIGTRLGTQIGSAIARSIKSSIQSAVSNIKIEGGALSKESRSSSASRGTLYGDFTNFLAGDYQAKMAQMESAMRKFSNVSSESMDKARADAIDFAKTLSSLNDMFSGLKPMDYSEFEQGIERLQFRYKSFFDSIREASSMMAPQLNKYFEQFNTGGFDKTLANMESQLKAYGDQSSASLSKASNELEQFRAKYAEIQALLASGEPVSQEKLLQIFGELTASGKQFANTMSVVGTELSKSVNLTDAIQKQKEVLAFLNNNQAAAEQYGEALRKLADDYAKVTNAADMASLDKQFKLLKTSIKFDGLTGGLIPKDTLKGLEQLETGKFSAIFSQMQATIRQFGDTSSDELTRIKGYYTEFGKEYDNLLRIVGTASSDNAFSGLNVDAASESIKRLIEITERYRNTVTELKSSVTPQLDKYFNQFNAGNFDKTLASMESQLKEYGNQSTASLEKARAELEQFRAKYAEIQAIMSSDQPVSQEKLVQLFGEMTEAGKRFANAMGVVQAETSKALAPGVALQGQQRVLAYLNENSKAAKKYGAQLRQLANDYAKCGTEAEKAQLDRTFATIQSAISKENLGGKSIFSEMGRAFKNIAEFAGIYRMIMMIPQAIKSMVNEVKAVDAELTTIRKITGASDKEISQMFEAATESAKAYGLAISDVIKAQADWIRLGYNMKEAKELADVTALFQQVGDNMTQESASTAIISAMKGFSLNVEDALHIVDAFNNVADHMPIATDEMASALTRSASAMHAAGNTMEQTMALITAANSVVQNPEKVGTAFQMISMRIRGAKSELEEAGLETEGMLTSVSKIREEVLGLSGVDIMLDENTFKSTYQILDELSRKWNDLTDIQQANLTELLASKRGGNIMSALMENFDIARNALSLGIDADGVAMKELENYQKGIEYHVGVMKATFQDFSNTAFNSDVIIGFVDALTQVLEVATNLVEIFGNLGSVISAVSIGKGISTLVKDFGQLRDIGNVITAANFGSKIANINPIAGIALDNTKIIEALSATNDINVAITALGKTGIDAGMHLELLRQAFPRMEEAEISAMLATRNLTESMSGGSGLLASLRGFVNMHPVLSGIMAVGAAFLAVNTIISLHQKSIEESRKKAQEAVDGFGEQTDGIEDQIRRVTELRTKLDEGTLSEEEAYKAKSELYNIQSSLVESYGVLAEGIDLVNGNLDAQIEKMRTLSQQEALQVWSQNQEAYNRAQKELNGTKRYTVKGSELYISGDEIPEAMSEYIEKGLEILPDEDNGMTFSFVGKAEDAYETFNALLDYMTNTFMVNHHGANEDPSVVGFVKDLGAYVTEIGDSIEANREIVDGMSEVRLYADSNLYGDVNPKTAASWYEEYKKAVVDLNNALATGTGVEEAYEHFHALDNEITGMIESGGAFSEYGDAFGRIGETFNKAGYDVYVSTKDARSYIEDAVKDLNIEEELKDLGKDGNVDLLVRPVVDAKLLRDVGYEIEDGLATVFTQTNTNMAGDVAMNFTPIQVDENGKLVRIVPEDELTWYAEQVAEGLREDDWNLKIGATFTGEDAVEKAEDAAKRIHELHEEYFGIEASEDGTQTLDMSWLPKDSIKKASKMLAQANVTSGQVMNWFKPSGGFEDEKFADNPEYSAFRAAVGGAKALGMLSFDDFSTVTYEQVKPLVSLFEEYGIIASDAADAITEVTEAEGTLAERSKDAAKDNKNFSKTMKDVSSVITKLESGKEVDPLSLLDSDTDVAIYGGALEQKDGKTVLNAGKLRDIAGEQIAEQIAENNALIEDFTTERQQKLDAITELNEKGLTLRGEQKEDNDRQIANLQKSVDAYDSEIAVLQAWNEVFSNLTFGDTLSENFDRAYENTEKTIDGLDKLQTVVTNVEKTGKLDLKILKDDDLKEYASAFEFVNGQVVVNKENLKELTEAKIADTVATNEATKALLDEQIARNNAMLAFYSHYEKGSMGGIFDSFVEGQITELQANNASLNETKGTLTFMNQVLSATQIKTEDVTESVTSLAEAYDKLAKASAKVMTGEDKINSVIDEYNKTGEFDPSVFDDEDIRDYASAFEFVNGQLVINEELIKSITKAKKEDAIATNNAKKAEIEARQAEIDSALSAYETRETLAKDGLASQLTPEEQLEVNLLKSERTNNANAIAGLEAYNAMLMGVVKTQTTFDEAIAHTNDSLKAFSTIDQIMDSLAKGEEIDISIFNSDEMLEYADALEVVNGELTVNADKLRAIAEQHKRTARAENNYEIARLQRSRKSKQADYEQALADENFAEAKRLSTEILGIDKQIAQFQIFNHLLDENIASLTGWKNAYNNAVAGTQTTMSAIDVINGAVDSVKSGEGLDASIFDDKTLYDYAEAFEVVNGELRVNEKRVNQITDAKIAEQVATNKATRALLQADYDRATREIETYNKALAEGVHIEQGRAAIQSNLDIAQQTQRETEIRIAQIDFVTQALEASISTYRTWTKEFEKSTSGTDKLMSNLSAMNSMVAGMATGKSVDYSIFDADGMLEYADAIEYVNGALHVNQERVNEITEAKVREQVAVNETAKAYGKEQYRSNLSTIAQYRQELSLLERGTAEYSAKLAQINALEKANEGIVNRTQLIDLYTQSLIESTGAYQEWLEAQGHINDKSMADDARSAMEYVEKFFTWSDKEGADNHLVGRFGEEEYTAAVNFLVPDSVSAEGQEAVKSYVENLKKYFTNDFQGTEKFIDEAIDKGLIDYDPDTDKIRIAANKTMEDFAEAFNWTPEMIRAMFGEIEAYHPEYDLQYTPYSRHEVFQENRGGADLTKQKETRIMSNGDKTETAVFVNPTLPNGEQFTKKNWMDYSHKIFSGGDDDMDIVARKFYGEDSQKQAQDYSDALDAVWEGYDKTSSSQTEAYEVLKDYDAETLRNIDFSKEATDENENARNAVLSLMDSYGIATENVQSFIDVMEDMGLIIGDKNQYNAKMRFEVEQVISGSDMSLEEIVAAVNDTETGADFISKTFHIDVENEEQIEQVRDIINTINAEQVEPITIKIDESSLEAINIMLHPDSSEIDEYEPDDEEATVKYDKDTTVPDAYQPKNPTAMVSYHINPGSLAQIAAVENRTSIDKTITYHVNTVGTNPILSNPTVPRFGKVNGTAHVNGTAFVGGKWAVGRDVTALTGELGTEIVVLKRHITW